LASVPPEVPEDPLALPEVPAPEVPPEVPLADEPPVDPPAVVAPVVSEAVLPEVPPVLLEGSVLGRVVARIRMSEAEGMVVAGAPLPEVVPAPVPVVVPVLLSSFLQPVTATTPPKANVNRMVRALIM
jgi:hypothetical protein